MSMAYGDEDFSAPVPLGDLLPLDLDDRHGEDEDLVGAEITRWRDLPADEMPGEWDRLRAFVEWFVPRYELSESDIPPCWYRHGRLVEELSALRSAWDASFIVETDGGLGPIGWHERYALARVRMREAYPGTCARGTHSQTTTYRVSFDENAWAEWRQGNEDS